MTDYLKKTHPLLHNYNIQNLDLKKPARPTELNYQESHVKNKCNRSIFYGIFYIFFKTDVKILSRINAGRE